MDDITQRLCNFMQILASDSKALIGIYLLIMSFQISVLKISLISALPGAAY